MRAAAAWLCSVALLCACDDGGSPLGPGAPPDPTITLRPITSGLSFPLFLTPAPGDVARLFVVEKGGRIKVLEDEAVSTTPFLDLSAAVSTGGEQGLLGLAFHPRYAQNGIFVVNYTDLEGDTRISTFRVTADPEVADRASERVILAVDQPFANHNGGMLAFGPDGKLYIGLGDGGSSGDPQGNAQNRNALLGKLLRLTIADDGSASVPADNPFAGQAGARPEIWSLGLRNPWRFSFDRTTGDLYIGDVGQNRVEEIDVVTDVSQFGRGVNFGWNVLEGNDCFSPSSGCSRTGLTPPIIEYDHGDACSVTGGYVYRGSAVPSLTGHYFYADFCAGWVRSFRLALPSVTDHVEWPSLRPGGQITSFGEDARGELYVLTAGGTIHRIVQIQR
ncbi:MAG: PQQ-dependent sugar dehydrogenase [Gemmatimonadales bacterium]